jgi:hypothetical protein
VIERIAPIVTGVPDGFTAALTGAVKSASSTALHVKFRSKRIKVDPLAHRRKFLPFGF